MSSPIRELIAAHINAAAEYERLLSLADWDLMDTSATLVALEVVEQAVSALAQASPDGPEECKLHRRYLWTLLGGALNGNPQGYPIYQVLFDYERASS